MEKYNITRLSLQMIGMYDTCKIWYRDDIRYVQAKYHFGINIADIATDIDTFDFESSILSCMSLCISCLQNLCHVTKRQQSRAGAKCRMGKERCLHRRVYPLVKYGHKSATTER